MAPNKLVSDPPKCEIEEIEDFVDHQFRCFKNFDTATFPPSDHHFLNPQADTTSFVCIKNFRSPITRSGGVGKNGGDAARKERILKEWGLLKTRLPNSIFVRAYSARPDLMRAAVIGLRHGEDDTTTNNNPYGYGLFFFDIMLPAQYPTKPPLIYHRYSGVGLETNRFVPARANRAISCFGEEEDDEDSEFGDARWDPEKSSVLHALGFLQRRVLRKGQQMKGERCNEVFMLSHRAMARTLRDPPSGFEDFVRGYFRNFSHVILMQLKGHLEDEGFRKSSGVGQGCMGELTFEYLVKEFEGNGSYCRHLSLHPSKLGKDDSLDSSIDPS